MLVSNTTLIKSILGQVIEIKHQIIVIKLSETIISSPRLLNNFAENIKLLSELGAKFVIVPEYESIVSNRLQEISGQQEVDYSYFGQDRLSELAEMIISGRIIPDIVSTLCFHSVQATSLSGKDTNAIVAKKPLMSSDSYMGEVESINSNLLLINASSNYISVVAPLGLNKKGKTTIVNADSVCSNIASAIGADHFIVLDEENYLTQNQIAMIEENEMHELAQNTLEIEFDEQKQRAFKSLFQSSSCTIHFLDSNVEDILITYLLQRLTSTVE